MTLYIPAAAPPPAAAAAAAHGTCVSLKKKKKRKKKGKTNQSRPYKCNELSKGKRRGEERKRSFYNVVYAATLIYAITLERTILITPVTSRLVRTS